MPKDYAQESANEQVASWTPTKLEKYRVAIHERTANELGDTPEIPLPKPLTNDFNDYLSSLGDGSRKLEGLSTGIESIDHLIGGLNKFVLLAARGGTGKSTLAVQLAVGVILTEEVPVLYYSFEMEKSDIYTMLLQNLCKDQDYKLTRREIILNGNKPINSTSAEAIKQSSEAAQEIGRLLYVIESRDGQPSLERMQSDIEHISEQHSKTPLVIIDSVQDLVQPENGNSTSAEAGIAQKIVELQQSTKATFLAISQKAKGSNLDDPYGSVLGSVAWIHKPTTVVELTSVYDLMRPHKLDPHIASNYRKLADKGDIPRPVVMSVIKGRNNGYGKLPLKHFGRYSYFEEGRIADYDQEKDNLYELNGVNK